MNTAQTTFVWLDERADRIVVTPDVRSVREGLIEMLPALRRYAWSLTRHRQNSEDLVQDAMVRMLAAEQRFQPGTDFKRWSFTVLRNLFLSGVRSKRGRQISLDDADLDAACTQADQSDGLELQDLQRRTARKATRISACAPVARSARSRAACTAPAFASAGNSLPPTAESRPGKQDAAPGHAAMSQLRGA
jgi:RNA polymerase sigma factor (sigma-70 family)